MLSRITNGNQMSRLNKAAYQGGCGCGWRNVKAQVYHYVTPQSPQLNFPGVYEQGY